MEERIKIEDERSVEDIRIDKIEKVKKKSDSSKI